MRMEVAALAWCDQTRAYLALLELGQFERAAAVGQDAVILFECWCDVVAKEHVAAFVES